MLVYAICADLIWNSKQILKSRTKFILAADEPLHDKRVGGRWWPDYGWYGIICPPIMGGMALFVPIMGGVALFVPIMGGMALCATGRAMWLNFGFLEKDSSWFRLQSLRKHHQQH